MDVTSADENDEMRWVKAAVLVELDCCCLPYVQRYYTLRVVEVL